MYNDFAQLRANANRAKIENIERFNARIISKIKKAEERLDNIEERFDELHKQIEQLEKAISESGQF